jgi:DNA-binding NtrC family response regulator
MANGGHVLIVEDQETERKALAAILKAEGMTVSTAESADKAVGYLDENVDVVLSDLNLGELSGMDLLQLWKQKRPDAKIILVTGSTSVVTAVEAMRAGAFDYVIKPVNPVELVLLIRRAIESANKDKELDNLRQRLDQKFGLEQIVGQSQQMKGVFDRIRRAAPVDSTVLILGESGTGKELVAQALHHNSPRKSRPFVPINVAAVPSTLVESELFGHVRGAFTGATDRRIGRFEQADGGTLFIDEIGDFEMALQAKLLRVLETLTLTPVGGHEDRKVDVRVVAATSRDIHKLLAEGKFREDLFYRLNVISINLPPLRDRPDDIPLLVEHFMKEITSTRRIAPRRASPDVMRRFVAYRWPGNVRELRNVLESMVVLADEEVLTEEDLPESLMRSGADASASPPIPAGMTMEELEKLAIVKALDQADGNRTRAAGRLGISVRTLQRKLRQYGVESRTRSSADDVLTQ